MNGWMLQQAVHPCPPSSRPSYRPHRRPHPPPACSIFVYVFLPPFLVDLAVRIDFFMLKKMG